MNQYMLRTNCLESSFAERGLADIKIAMNKQHTFAAKKVDSTLESTRKSITIISREMIILLCSALVSIVSSSGVPSRERWSYWRVQLKGTKTIKGLEHFLY